MVVMVILGLLAAIVTPRIVGVSDHARYEQARAQMRILEDALKLYRLDNGSIPAQSRACRPWCIDPPPGSSLSAGRRGAIWTR